MKTINIKGKEYIEVNERIKEFRLRHPEGAILTEMLSNENGLCIFKARIIVNEKLVATGHAYEKEGSTFINKTSYIENCETSAVGRALGIFSIGIDTSIASAEEVQNAIKNQNSETITSRQATELSDMISGNDKLLTKVKAAYKVKDLSEIKKLDFSQVKIRIQKALAGS